MEDTTLETLEVSPLNLLDVTLGEVMERDIPVFEMLSVSTTPPETRRVLGRSPLKIGDMIDGAMLSLSLSLSLLLFKESGGGVRIVAVFRWGEGILVESAEGLGFSFGGTVGRGARSRSAVASFGVPREPLTLQQSKRRKPAAYFGTRGDVVKIGVYYVKTRHSITTSLEPVWENVKE